MFAATLAQFEFSVGDIAAWVLTIAIMLAPAALAVLR